MKKEDFKQRVLEQRIFEELKDKPMRNSEWFRKKYKDSDIDHTRVYVKIVNYQVKTYGSSLDRYADIPSPDEREKLRKRQNQRRHRRLKG